MGFQFSNRVFVPASESGGLTDGRRIDEHVLLQFVDGLYEPLGYNHPTQSPSRHGIIFRKTVNDHNVLVVIVGTCCRILQGRDLWDVPVGNAVVYFVGHENDVFLVAELAQFFQFQGCKHSARWIGRRRQNQPLDGRAIVFVSVSNFGLEFLGRDFVFAVDRNGGDFAAQGLQYVSVTRISRGGNRYRIARIETPRKGQQKGTGTPRCHYDL
mmetsp:Transcript_3227/g.6962  ORF Transcript_3227/g.6962 Transcript_3227/m.6962 type:complete len:212 (+) Transcript_3227:4098-4733(+)